MNQSNHRRQDHPSTRWEILQVSTPSRYNEDLTYAEVGRDISCNPVAEHRQGDGLTGLRPDHRGVDPRLPRSAIRTHITSVPSIENGNSQAHAIGLGQMNLHGYPPGSTTTAPKRA